MKKEEQELRYKKWRELIKEQGCSGLKQSDFCKERNLSSAQMSYYRGVFKSKQMGGGTFSAITIKPSPSVRDIRITLPNGFQCIFPCDLNAPQIKEWILVLLSC